MIISGAIAGLGHLLAVLVERDVVDGGRAVGSGPLPPSRAAFSNAVPRTVITFLASFDLTVAMALPA